jgi:hypothetical protein
VKRDTISHRLRRDFVPRNMIGYRQGVRTLLAGDTPSLMSFETASNVVFNVLLAFAGSRVLSLIFAKIAESAAPPLKLPANEWTRMVRPDYVSERGPFSASRYLGTTTTVCRQQISLTIHSPART